MEGEWQPDGSIGNPCKSEVVGTWKRTYRVAQQVCGVGESSAEPLKAYWHNRMLATCREDIAGCRDFQLCGRIARDALMLSFLWETGQRIRPQLGPYTRDMIVNEGGCPVWSFAAGRRDIHGPILLDV